MKTFIICGVSLCRMIAAFARRKYARMITCLNNEEGNMKYVIRFRYIPPDDYMTPLMHIPIEQTIIEAETPELAWTLFIGGVSKEHQAWLKREEIFQYTPYVRRAFARTG